jgi:hypothetical protein
MNDIWYYVVAGERKGPVEVSIIQNLISEGKLGEDDYVWRKGFENWIKLKDIEEFQNSFEEELPSALPSFERVSSNNLLELAGGAASIFLKIGMDRGVKDTEYGPYTLDVVKKLFVEKRINARTLIFVRGMDNWQILADFADFSEIFSDVPPPIKDEDRRINIRKPFVARMYIQKNADLSVGICRDISIGGMQVLVDNFKGSIGETISINVHPENTDHHFVAAGTIVRILEGGQGFSFRFEELSEKSKLAVQKYLADD